VESRQDTPGESDLPPLIRALRDPNRYPHPVDRVKVIETHISYVLLAGDFAYKIKKPLALGFLDFRQLHRRHYFCGEELRLNRRFAPQIYLDVLAISGTPDAPRLGEGGKAIEYAVQMRRFSQGCMATTLATNHEIGVAEGAALAEMLASMHAAAQTATRGAPFATSEVIGEQARANIDALQGLLEDAASRALLGELSAWTEVMLTRLAPAFQERLFRGAVRECHGDLHLGNICWLEGAPVPFDCLEFDPALRWIDVMSELAFLLMDLLDRKLGPAAWRCLDRYLEITGDYEGVGVLRFYLVYRALVRGKVAALRAAQEGIPGDERVEALGYLRLAGDLIRDQHRAMILMHGLSGSGKSTVARALVDGLGAIRLRSDVERKRMHGLAAEASSDEAQRAQMYSAAASEQVYTRLCERAVALAVGGWPAIVDAAFLRREERDRFRTAAAKQGLAFRIVSCSAPPAVLRERVSRRAEESTDASEATVAVLEKQTSWIEPLGVDDEVPMSISADSTRPEPCVTRLRGILGDSPFRT
jgi:aminoglycoside phosphotransferase family enzyme/predicted kinase